MIVTCAFREPYLTHNTKQLETLTGVPVLSFRDCLPYSEGLVTENIVGRFQKSLYGFKPHAIQKAIDMGYKKVIWFDPSVYPLEPIENLFEQLNNSEMLVVKSEHHIRDMTNKKAYDYFGIDPDINHIGGTIYGFNFNHEKTLDAFKYWKDAEIQGIFGTQDEFMAGHWADESCMSLSMAKAGIEQKSINFKYKNQKDG